MIKETEYHNNDPESKKNWDRFCKKYDVAEIYKEIPVYKVVGCRSDKLRFPLSVLDHGFGVRTRSGEYYAVGSNYNRNGEIDKMRLEIPLGNYHGKTYTARGVVLPKEYSFHNPDSDCRTVLFKVECSPTEKI